MTGDTTVRRTPAGCRRTLVSITAAVTERFHLANIKLLVKELLRGRRTSDPGHKRSPWERCWVAVAERLRKVKITAGRGLAVVA